MKYSFLSILVSVTLISCGGDSAPSEEEIQTEFNLAVELAKDCTEDSECTLVYAGCPLGCDVAVSSSEAERISNLASSLRREFQSGGAVCDFSCIPMQAMCSDNRCESLELY